MAQFVVPFIPGYMYDGTRLVSTGIAIPPTQHINYETGEVMYYVRPIFDNLKCGMYVRHNGIIEWAKQNGYVL
jgi:hypothetical protein